MDLILWRHAQAEDGMPDARRALTRRGEQDAANMGRWLRERLPRDALVLVSPTQRTRQTADALGLAYEVVDAIGPGAAPQDVLAAAGWPGPDDRVVVVVGHQPWVGLVAATVVSGRAEPWPVRKGALWWLSGHARGDRSDVLVRAVLGPDALR